MSLAEADSGNAVMTIGEMSENTERFYIDGAWVEPVEPRFADIVDPCHWCRGSTRTATKPRA